MRKATVENLDQNQGTTPVSSLERLDKEHQVDTNDITNPESLTYVVLDLTVNQYYDKAVREARSYLDYKSNYPNYRDRAARYFEHIENTINAIKTKKNLVSISNLPASKKKEMGDVISFHFRDLKKSLQRVCQIEAQLRQNDSRSTLLVVNTLLICTFVVIVFALAREAFDSMRAPLEILQQDIVRWLYKTLGI